MNSKFKVYFFHQARQARGAARRRVSLADACQIFWEFHCFFVSSILICIATAINLLDLDLLYAYALWFLLHGNAASTPQWFHAKTFASKVCRDTRWACTNWFVNDLESRVDLARFGWLLTYDKGLLQDEATHVLQVQAAVEAADDAEVQKDPGCLRKVRRLIHRLMYHNILLQYKFWFGNQFLSLPS